MLSLAPLYAITYIVPQDRDLVRRADAIAVVTAGQSHAEIAADGRIVTVIALTVGERIKGDLASEVIQLVEPGGIVGDRGMMIPGSPRFDAGRSYLVFLRKTKQGEWATWGFQLGQFELTLDINGAPIATRMGQEREVFGFNEADWSPHSEKLRDAKAFLNFVRGEVAQVGSQTTESYLRDPAQTIILEFPEFRPRADFVIRATATRADYLLSGNFRWQSPSAAFRYCCAPTFQPGLDGPGASSAAMSNWNGAGAGISYSLGTPNTAQASGPPGDGQNTIIFNDPINELAGAFPGAAAYGQITVGSGSYSNLGDGITYISTQEVDVVVAKNISGIGQATFTGVMTHELGHTLGFRHSNQNGGGGNCAAPLVCTGDAVMNSIIPNGLQSLRPYDTDAAQTVYGSGPVCTPPTIASGPQSQTITAGDSVNLSVTAGGSGPFTYQWFIGTSASGTAISGATSSTLSQTPASTTSYFVRVTGQCAPTAGATATVTVAPCQNPVITQNPVGSSISQGSGTQLTVGATGTGLTYQWFSGASAANATPSTGTAIGGSNSASIQVFPASTTFYSVRVSGACGTPQNSTVAQVTVTPPGCPAINAPAPSSSGGPNTFTLTAFPSGGTITMIAWFTAGGGTTPFSSGTQTSISVTPNGPTTYFYQASNSCGNVTNSGLTAVTPTGPPPCSVALTASGPANAIAGANFNLTSTFTGTATGLRYQWYRGNSGDLSSPIDGAVSPTFTTSITSTSSYFVRATSSCGASANSNTVTVNLNTGQCTAATDLCVDGLRYKVSLVAKDPTGKTAQGKALYQTDVFGYFSLAEFTGDAGNPEVFVKVLGPTAKGPIVFYSGLTNLDYTITVTDLQTGQVFKQYRVTPPPAGSLISKGDFDFEGNVSTACADITVTKSQESPGSCVTDGSTLCLLNRFRVTMSAFDDRSGKTVSGQTIPKNSVFGFFSTPGLSNDPSNVEAFVKAINATSFDGHYWIFLGGLTDVQYDIKVVDTVTGKANNYRKPLRSTCGLNDVSAFNAP
ncbi:MAG: hypothetical protein ABIP63_02130 [Thermoanaerobaculia bacterium]